MRVAIVTESTAWGGLEAHVAALAETLVQVNHQVSIVCIGAPAARLFRCAAPDGVDLIEVPLPGRRTISTWRRAFGSIVADAVVLEKGTLHAGGLALDIVLRLKFRRYIVVQQLEPPELPPRTSRRYLRGLIPGMGLWWFRWRASGYLRSIAPQVTVCVSHSVSRRLASDYAFSPSRLITIHNGVDSTRFRPDAAVRNGARDSWSVSRDAFVFGSVGRLVRQKGLDIAVQAFARLMRSLPELDAYLILVGEGPQQASLRDLSIQLGLEQRILLPGFASNPAGVYPGLDVFLLPSRFEGLPFSLVEALACGCDVIATAVSGIPETISNPRLGTLVAPEDPMALAEAMKNAVMKRHTESTGDSSEGRRHVIENFNLRSQCLKIVRLLENLPMPMESS